jgi:hypothetical protein
MKEKKLLQIVNLSPSESWLENITEIHPMKQITYASILQVVVFGFMLFSFSMISLGLQASDFDFEQMKEDAERIEASEYSYNFDLQNPKHKYFVVVNALDVATTIYAMEHRNSLTEANFLLPTKPKPEELLLQKFAVTYIMSTLGLFSTRPEDQHFINSLNVVTTVAVLNNLHYINTNE